MHSSCKPSRMSIPMGQTATHWLQAMQSPRWPQSGFFFSGARGSPRHFW